MNDVVIRILLLPLSLLYGLGVSLRNTLYKFGLLRSVSFDLPVISVGNLSVGGAGKSPHIEYLIQWLNQYINPGVLSRGYGRKTAGFLEVQPYHSPLDTGDEPLQFKRKFQHIPIVVSESRALGVPQMVRSYPDLQCVLLDDAFQHRSVTPGLNILLTEYARLFTRDWLLPSGRLREWRSAYRRADVIIVTKCPDELTVQEQERIIKEIKPFPRQQVFFSKYNYGTPYYLFTPNPVSVGPDTDVLLVSAIANSDYLLAYLSRQVRSVQTLEFEDHHVFDEGDLSEIKRRYAGIDSANKVIVTTEKDATRLRLHADDIIRNGLNIVVLPAYVQFMGDDEAGFQARVRRFLEDFMV